MEERQTKYTIAEGYDLPSRGLIYDVPVDPHVEIRSMTGRDEMKRLSPSSTPFKTLADLIEGCLIEKPAIHVYDMALADYEYLLHKLRIVSYGDSYKMDLTCPYCGKTSEYDIHLEDLTLTDLDLDAFNETRRFILPRSNHEIVLRPQTPHMLDDQAFQVKELRRKFKDSDTAFDVQVELALAIVSVDGNKLNTFELNNFLNNLPAMDLAKIQNNLSKLNHIFGLNTEFITTCKHCNNDMNAFFRFGPEFFRPSNI